MTKVRTRDEGERIADKTAKLDHPCFPYSLLRVLESSRTSVNPSWIMIERYARAIDMRANAYRDNDFVSVDRVSILLLD